jgi:hypothetical protein
VARILGVHVVATAGFTHIGTHKGHVSEMLLR